MSALLEWALDAIRDEISDTHQNWCGMDVCACEATKERLLSSLSEASGIPKGELFAMFQKEDA